MPKKSQRPPLRLGTYTLNISDGHGAFIISASQEAGQEAGDDESQAIASISDTTASINETIAPNNDTAASTEDTIAPNNDTISSINDTVAPNNDTAASINDTIAPNHDTAASINDTTVPKTEAHKTWLDRLLASTARAFCVPSTRSSVSIPSIRDESYDPNESNVSNDLNDSHEPNDSNDSNESSESTESSESDKPDESIDIQQAINAALYRASAAYSVFQTAELLENILLEVDNQTLLMGCNRTSQFFRSTILGSPTLQQQLWFTHKPPSQFQKQPNSKGGDPRTKIISNTLLTHRENVLPRRANGKLRPFQPNSYQATIVLNFSSFSICPNHGSWRSMLILQFPPDFRPDAFLWYVDNIDHVRSPPMHRPQNSSTNNNNNNTTNDGDRTSSSQQNSIPGKRFESAVRFGDLADMLLCEREYWAEETKAGAGRTRQCKRCGKWFYHGGKAPFSIRILKSRAKGRRVAKEVREGREVRT